MLIRPIFAIVLLMRLVGPAAAQSAPIGQLAIAVCSACHSIKPGENRMGPTLFGVVGRKVGSVAGYEYSRALAKRQSAWTTEELDIYLRNPQAAVPGTKMYFSGIVDTARRRAVISYLATLKKE